MLRDLFRSSGHEVCLAEDGLAALASIREREPDLVVLDHSMPGMSGFEVCRNMKRNPFTARIPVLMLTAQSEIARKQLAALTVREMRLERGLNLIYRKGASLSHAARAFLRVAKETRERSEQLVANQNEEVPENES